MVADSLRWFSIEPTCSTSEMIVYGNVSSKLLADHHEYLLNVIRDISFILHILIGIA
jgi:hypothetical protein